MDTYKDTTSVSNIEIEPFTLIKDILSNLLFIVLGAIAAALIAYVVVNARYVPQYQTSTTFVVSSKDSNYTYSNLYSANTMATTLQKVLESTVMNTIISEEMGSDEVNAEIQAEVLEGTNLLVVTVTADRPKDAIDILRVVTEHYSDVALYTVSNAVMSVLEEPSIPYTPINYLDVRGAMKQAAMIAALICTFLFGILSYMKNTVKQESEVEQKLDARKLGAINYERKYKTIRQMVAHKKSAILVDSPICSFPFVESYRKLAAKVEYQMAKENRKILAITSVSENEGKSTVAANLAITLSSQGKKVILIDGDIRRPSQFLILGIDMEEKHELGEFLKGQGVLQDVMRKTDREGLFFLGGRNCYSSSMEILQSERMPKLLQACGKYADYVLVDTPPAGLMGDAQLFASAADGVLVVVRQNFRLAEEVNDVLDELRGGNAKVLGVVLNGVQSFSNLVDASSRYGKYGHYGSYYNKGRG